MKAATKVRRVCHRLYQVACQSLCFLFNLLI